MDFKIIVIEDEFSINDILTFALKGEGYKVKSVFSSKEAREFLQDFKPNLVLLDINLPDESGFELCKFINANYKIPIIMLTARNDITDKILGLELGADDYITKPFHIKEVSIKSSMKDTMKSSREYIKYNMLPKDLYMGEEVLCEKLWSILNGYILTHNYEKEIRTPSGKIEQNTISSDFTELTYRGTKEAIKERIVINLQYSKDNVQAILSYPLYDGNRCLGILNISKSFGDSYTENKRIINIITLIELFVFIFVFTASYLFTSRIIKSIIKLTKQIKKIEEGDYEINLNIKNNDEIGILLKEFINMKEKIRNQIETISMEKVQLYLNKKIFKYSCIFRLRTIFDKSILSNNKFCYLLTLNYILNLFYIKNCKINKEI